MHLSPSYENGLDTTATVSAPSDLATSATIGAAPVPVPPPIPAAMKTIWAPLNASSMRLRDSSASWRPTSGRMPAPRPVSPIWIILWASECDKACASVLAAINSTPETPLLIICWTALPPAPPTPTTLMMVPSVALSTISNSMISLLSEMLFLFGNSRAMRQLPTKNGF